MTMPAAVVVESLWKEYRLGAPAAQNTFREMLMNLARRPSGTAERQAFWALRDVGFAVQPGEVIGIIGRNGAGKSTLLKILSRITAPTRGRITIRGRVSSLLEVGTGFHPELTGRENVFLNGAILGMRRREIQAKFDAIVAFANVAKFIDTPVKHYSSGMIVRLAFSVAAHLEPEILIIDEVLTVGDREFQRKCLGRMEDLSRGEGRTVLFVSHDLPAVRRICRRGLLIESGGVAMSGGVGEVVDHYVRQVDVAVATRKEWAEPRPGNASAQLRIARLVDVDGHEATAFEIRRPIAVEIDVDLPEPGYAVAAGINLYDQSGVHLFSSHDPRVFRDALRFDPGRYTFRATIPADLLAPGTFTLDVALVRYEPLEVVANERNVLSFSVADVFDGSGARGTYMGPVPGVLRPLLEWSHRRTAEAGSP